MTTEVKAPKKLIEVALPLDDINAAAAREKSIRHGHPSTLHLWWARRPLAAARAVIFAQLVNDPSWKWELENPGRSAPAHLKGGWATARKRLFKILSDLVKWESTTDEQVLAQARDEIRKSWRETCDVNKGHPRAAELFNPDRMPGLHDPFAGGGAIPLEAQRLGLDSYASDLNPVAVLINKAMIEIPPRFAGRNPVGPTTDEQLVDDNDWSGTKGLAEDVRRYGAWMREEAEKRIGHLYPQIEVTKAMAKDRPDLNKYVGQKLKVIAWLWARTVRSPSPAFSHVEVPLSSTFILSNKEGKQSWVEPVVNGDSYRFVVRTGKPPSSATFGTKTGGKHAEFLCLMSDAPLSFEYLRGEFSAGRGSSRLMAIVAEGSRERVYVSPTPDDDLFAAKIEPSWRPQLAIPEQALGFRVQLYGMRTYGDLFTRRQLSALSVFSSLVNEVRERVRSDALLAGRFAVDERALADGGEGATAYADAVATFLGFVVDKEAETLSTICIWSPAPKNELIMGTFRRQALPMTWDFAEANPFASSTGSLEKNVDVVAKVVSLALPASGRGESRQADAQSQDASNARFVSTDPPYYDNIGYSDLSDYLYVWLRRSLIGVYPDLLATVSVPKAQELVANAHRYGSKEGAEAHFLSGMSATMTRLATSVHPAAPVSIYYAFKQSETDGEDGTSSPGWVTFLGAVVSSGFQLTGTWPIRTERDFGVKSGANVLASSVVLVCRRRLETAPSVSRRDFVRELNRVLPEALDEMTKGSGEDRSPVAPVDLSQAIIGPGMAVFSKYSAVLEADGTPMTVRSALQIINRFLAEADFDADSQFCLHWFDQYHWGEAAYGEADVLARAKATSVAGLEEAGVLKSRSGKVKLLKWSEYPLDWDASTDKRLPVWEALHQLILRLDKGGESSAAQVLAAVRDRAEAIRQLAYRLYTLCERKGLAEDARAYNELVTSWTAIETAASAVPEKLKADPQLKMFS